MIYVLCIIIIIIIIYLIFVNWQKFNIFYYYSSY